MTGCARDLESEPAFGIDLGGVIGHELGFNDDGGAASRGDEHVGRETGPVDELLRVLVENVVPGQHAAQQVAQGVVGVSLDLLGHWGGSWVGVGWIIQAIGG